MKIGLLTCSTPNRERLYSITNKTKELYCKDKPNVKFVFANDFTENLQYGAYWLKPAFLLKNIQQYDYILWTDDDAGIVDRSFDLESYIESSLDKEKSIFMARDENCLNTGVLLLRNSKETLDCLKYVNSKAPLKEYQNGWAYDQTAFIEYINAHKEFFQELPGSIFNAHDPTIKNVPNIYCDKTFICHIAGGELRRRILFSIPGFVERFFRIA